MSQEQPTAQELANELAVERQVNADLVAEQTNLRRQLAFHKLVAATLEEKLKTTLVENAELSKRPAPAQASTPPVVEPTPSVPEA